jgi:serine/threonine protein kinase
MAEDGQVALAAASASAPDLIISDISMPHMDGFALLEAVRRQQSTSFIPFILLSQHGDVSVFRRGMELGADDFLAKPVKRQDLLNSVAARLKRSERLRQRPLTETSLPTSSAVAVRPIPSILGTPAARPVAVSTGGAPDLEGYRLVKKLGEGGMSQVFLAERADTGARHVLKLARMGGESNNMMQRFLAEYALVSQIDHLNVARIFHQGFSATHAYIAMEYFADGDLRNMLNQTITPLLAVAILIQVASGLSAVHAKGIVHRDMKPDNIMIRTNGSLALADFGIAKHLHSELHYTAHGEVFGTPAYIAPEQATGQQIDERTDIYSLGAMFFELLAGRCPYQAKDAQAMLHQHVHAPLPALPPELEQFKELVHNMLAKRREQRPSSAYDVVRYLASGMGISIAESPIPARKRQPPRTLEIIGFGQADRIIIASLLSLSMQRDFSFALQTESPTHPDVFLVDTHNANGQALLQEKEGFGNVPVVMVGDGIPQRPGKRIARLNDLAALLTALEASVSTTH